MMRFMKNKILIPLLIVGGISAFLSFRYTPEKTEAEGRKQLVLAAVLGTIQSAHFSPQAIDDSLSYRIYHKILDQLDYEKNFFTQEDINALKPYEFKIDDQLNKGSMEFFDKLDVVFVSSIDRAEGYYKDILKTPFTFTGSDSIQLNGEEKKYAANATELKARWKQYMKYRVLAKYIDLKKEQEKSLADKTGTAKPRTDAQLEADARESVMKNQDYYFKRLRKLKADERFTLYVNAIANSEDPHTDYLAPEDKARFDESMSGTFSGIGASLQEKDGKITVAAIIAGSPCWKQGELKAGDEITKVGQGNAEPVDVQGYEINDVVKLIRGKKGTEVRLTVRKMDGAVKVIPIIRGDVQLEETFAKSAIINGKNGPVGYIYLPEFYADFQHVNGRESAEDVGLEIEKLKKAGVVGIILDLRNNGGGSLGDVVDMAGFFIDKGPIVQVKTSGSAPQVLPDREGGTRYDGPLAIMVNQNSASASEIMAAAMQDYKRAIIVGAPTYGKGTVQRVFSLDEALDPATKAQMQLLGIQPIGSLKMTVQKFYRINGGSTQLRGVTPDVVLPDPYQLIDLGERRDPAALPWDEIPQANYRPVPNRVNVSALTAASQKRINANATFGLITQSAARLQQQQQNLVYPLNEMAFRKKLDEANALSEQMEELEKKATLPEVVNLREDLPKVNLDSSTIVKNADWLKNIRKDIYINETVNIINDMVNGNARLQNATGMKD